MVVTNLLVQIKISLCAMLFRDGHSLEVVTNLCFVTLMDVSKHICKLKLVFYGFNIMA